MLLLLGLQEISHAPFEALVLLVGGAADAAARAGLRRGRLGQGAVCAGGARASLPARRGSARQLQAQLRHSPYLLVALHPCNSITPHTWLSSANDLLDMACTVARKGRENLSEALEQQSSKNDERTESGDNKD